MSDTSIIIPTLNRASLLRDVLNSIGEAVGPSDAFEILIVDNGSIDETAIVSREIGRKFPRYEWRYLYEPMPGLLSGRHRGAKEARGEILAFLDDDVVLAPSWPNALQDAFSSSDVALVGGPSRPQYEVEPPDWLEVLWAEADGYRILSWLSLITSRPSVSIIDPLYVFGLNFSIRKSVLEACGGFHPDCIQPALQRYQGDGETGLSLKVKAAGLLAVHHPGVAVTHVIRACRLTIQNFERRAFYQGVCDSYAQIRRARGMPIEYRRSWRDLVRPAKWKLERDVILRRPTAEGVRRLMARAYSAGVQFHGNEVRNDPLLLDWVLRKDYFDYRLPDGWERYFGAAQYPSRGAGTQGDQIVGGA